MAAIEFALIAPLMTTCLLGTIELTNIMRVQAKVNVVAGQLAEFVAGQPAVIIGPSPGGAYTAQSLSDMCAGAAMNMLPYNTAAVQASIGSVTVGTSFALLHPITDWTTDVSCGATNYHAGQTLLYTLANSPRSLFTQDGTPFSSGGTAVNGYSAISVQVRYQYANILPNILGRSITLVAVAVARPRSNAAITCTIGAGSGASACPQNP